MVSTKIIELKVSVPALWGEAVSGVLFELGAAAVEEIPSQNGVTLVTHYPKSGLNSKIVALGNFLSAIAREMNFKGSLPKIDLRGIEARSWAEEARKAFKPVRVAGNFWAVPSWISKKSWPQGEILLIDPGEAFGTGLHASTQLAAELLIEEASLRKQPVVLDIGTGTGILAMIAKRAGAGQIMATDNDPVAIEVAGKNFKRNSCLIELTARPLDELSRKFDMIIANILLETLLEIAPQFKCLLKKEGSVILSGLLEEQGAEMRKKMKAIGINTMEKQVVSGDWLAQRYRL